MDLSYFLNALGQGGHVDNGHARSLIRDVENPLVVFKLLSSEFSIENEFLVKTMAETEGFRFVTFAEILASAMIESLASPELFQHYRVVPFDLQGGRLQVATIDPFQPGVMDKIEDSLGYGVDPVQTSLESMNSVAIALFGSQLAEEFYESQLSAVNEAMRSSHNDSDQLVSMPTLDVSLPSIAEMLKIVIDSGASDLHLTAGSRPTIRVDGHLIKIDDAPILDPVNIRELVYSILTDGQRDRFEAERELDASYGIAGLGRFRINVFRQRGSVGAVMRAIPASLAPLSVLGLPKIVETFASIPRGLILVTGPTGSGKSTTLASMIDLINLNRDCHIMTVEDPIEFLHNHKTALINQREVGEDTHGFAEALRHVLRQDPDVILVGELRDHETISMALTAAETGHAVYASLHTQDAPQSIDRIIDVFPSYQQAQIRIQLALSLQGVVTQQLLPKASGHGRCVAAEVLVATPAVRNLIREAKVHQVYSSMQAGASFGMQTMESSLAQLVKSRTITPEVAMRACSNPDELRRLINSASQAPIRRGA